MIALAKKILCWLNWDGRGVLDVLIAHIHNRPNAKLSYEDEVAHYLKGASRWLPARSQGFNSEDALRTFVDRVKVRTGIVLCDQRGKSLTSLEFASWVGERRDSGVGQLILGLGPADGWSAEMLARADLGISFGAMTLPHALARLVLAEQVYRAATILGGHPYHTGH